MYSVLHSVRKMLTCSCKADTNSIFEEIVHEWPSHLSIHFIRNEICPMTQRQNKNHKIVPLSETLSPKENVTYDLVSFLVHIGQSFSCGHYVAYVRSNKNIWYVIILRKVRNG